MNVWLISVGGIPSNEESRARSPYAKKEEQEAQTGGGIAGASKSSPSGGKSVNKDCHGSCCLLRRRRKKAEVSPPGANPLWGAEVDRRCAKRILNKPCIPKGARIVGLKQGSGKSTVVAGDLGEKKAARSRRRGYRETAAQMRGRKKSAIVLQSRSSAQIQLFERKKGARSCLGLRCHLQTEEEPSQRHRCQASSRKLSVGQAQKKNRPSLLIFGENISSRIRWFAQLNRERGNDCFSFAGRDAAKSSEGGGGRPEHAFYPNGAALRESRFLLEAFLAKEGTVLTRAIGGSLSPSSQKKKPP